MEHPLILSPGEAAHRIRAQLPPGGLFANQEWRTSPRPFLLTRKQAEELEWLGRVLLQFNRAVNLLYRQSLAGKQPSWVAQWLELGKPDPLIARQRHPAFKNDLPRVIRPDLLLTETGFKITELDSVPGGIGLTAWLHDTFAGLDPSMPLIGGVSGMIDGFAAIFNAAPRVHIVISAESATYRPEMEWLAGRFPDGRLTVRSADYLDFKPGDAVYRFFELFDAGNIPCAEPLFDLAQAGQIRLTPPPKAIFEEKLLFALLWNRNLRDFWRQQLGENFFERLLKMVPYTWVIDPAPLPPHGAIPELNLTDWRQLMALSQRERALVLKVSGFSDTAWGARGVYVGSDLPLPEWTDAVDLALRSFTRSPYVLQRFEKPALVQSQWYDFDQETLIPLPGRARLCPYYFVAGDGDAARTRLGGVLATVCPAEKKIIHGMRDAVLVPCALTP